VVGFITGQFLEVQCRHIKEYRLTPCCVLLCTNAYLFIYQGTVRCFFRAQIYRVHGFRPFYHGMIFMLQNPGILENHICLFYVENAIGNEKGEKWR